MLCVEKIKIKIVDNKKKKKWHWLEGPPSIPGAK